MAHPNRDTLTPVPSPPPPVCHTSPASLGQRISFQPGPDLHTGLAVATKCRGRPTTGACQLRRFRKTSGAGGVGSPCSMRQPMRNVPESGNGRFLCKRRKNCLRRRVSAPPIKCVAIIGGLISPALFHHRKLACQPSSIKVSFYFFFAARPPSRFVVPHDRRRRARPDDIHALIYAPQQSPPMPAPDNRNTPPALPLTHSTARLAVDKRGWARRPKR